MANNEHTTTNDLLVSTTQKASSVRRHCPELFHDTRRTLYEHIPVASHSTSPADLVVCRLLKHHAGEQYQDRFTSPLEMHDEIFYFEIFKTFMKILKYFKTPSLKHFMKFLIFIIKWLKTFKNMTKVYEVSRKYIMLFTHNNRYLPLTGLLTLLQWAIQPAPYCPKKTA